jgi:hypothetical protein
MQSKRRNFGMGRDTVFRVIKFLETKEMQWFSGKRSKAGTGEGGRGAAPK